MSKIIGYCVQDDKGSSCDYKGGIMNEVHKLSEELVQLSRENVRLQREIDQHTVGPVPAHLFAQKASNSDRMQDLMGAMDQLSGRQSS